MSGRKIFIRDWSHNQRTVRWEMLRWQVLLPNGSYGRQRVSRKLLCWQVLFGDWVDFERRVFQMSFRYVLEGRRTNFRRHLFAMSEWMDFQQGAGCPIVHRNSCQKTYRVDHWHLRWFIAPSGSRGHLRLATISSRARGARTGVRRT